MIVLVLALSAKGVLRYEYEKSMKAKNNILVIVFGLPGSGKSFFAERLASHLNATYINTDRVRRSVRESSTYSLEEKLLVYKEMATQAKRAILDDKPVVVDGTFYKPAMVELFNGMATDLSVPVFFIEVTAEEALIRERLKVPRKYSEADFAVYEKIRREFERVEVPHLRLQSTNNNIETMIRQAVEYIRK